jgi:hypothetical protein
MKLNCKLNMFFMLSTPLLNILRFSRWLNQSDATDTFPNMYVQLSTTIGNTPENNRSIFTIIIKWNFFLNSLQSFINIYNFVGFEFLTEMLFRRDVSTQSSGYKNKPSKIQTWKQAAKRAALLTACFQADKYWFSAYYYALYPRT